MLKFIQSIFYFLIGWFGAWNGITLRKVMDPRQWILPIIAIAIFGWYGVLGILIIDIMLAALWSATHFEEGMHDA